MSEKNKSCHQIRTALCMLTFVYVRLLQIDLQPSICLMLYVLQKYAFFPNLAHL